MVSGFGSPMVLKRRDLKSDTMNFIGTPLRETHFSCSFARQYTSLFHLGFSTSPQTRLFTEESIQKTRVGAVSAISRRRS